MIARIIFLCALIPLAACRQDMNDQARYEPLKKSDFFSDGSASRPVPARTVSREAFHEDEVFYSGKINDREFANTLPMPLTRELLQRGRERFDIYCAVCHGRTGEGRGMIVQRGFPQPPSYATARLRDAPLGYFYHVMTQGYGLMYSYADRVEPADRWAIAAYIRVLQLSRQATLADATMVEREKLERAPDATAK
ncbi:MAG TPA: cytochrome c [Verrucomicrobiaceae bacterium]|jgi:cytochrome c553